MDAVVGHQERYPQARPRDQPGRFEDALRRGVQERADELVRNEIVEVAPGIELQHLPHLLGEGHLSQEALHALAHGERAVEVSGGWSLRTHGTHGPTSRPVARGAWNREPAAPG